MGKIAHNKCIGTLQKAIFCSSFESIFEQIIVFVTGIIMARMLTPKSYGICGILMIFVTISQGLVDAGLGAALIYHREESQTEYHDSITVFWINVLFSILCYFLLFASSGMIANFNRTPEMRSLLRVLAFLVIINALGLVQRNLFRKRLELFPIAIANIIGYLIGGIIGIVCAYHGLEAWSLVYYRLSKTTVEVIILYSCSSWRPKLEFYTDRIKTLFNYGLKFAIQGIIESLFNNIDSLIIGHCFNMSSVGYYARAQSLVAMPRVFLQGITGRVFFPFFASLQNDIETAKKKFVDFIMVLCSLLLLAMGALWVIAPHIIRLLLTDKWISTVPLVRVLCLFAWTYPIITTTNALLNGIGAVSSVIKLTIVQKATMLLISLCCSFFSLEVFAAGIGVGVLLNAIFGLYAVKLHVSLRLFRIVVSLTIKILVIACFYAGVYFLFKSLIVPPIIQIILVLGVTLIIGIVFLLRHYHEFTTKKGMPHILSLTKK